MIRKLQRKFIKIAGLSVLILLISLLIPLNLLNYFRIGNQMRKTLGFIIESDGNLSNLERQTEADGNYWTDLLNGMLGTNTNVTFTPESKYQLRYFLVSYDKNGEIIDTSLTHIAALETGDAEKLAGKWYKRQLNHGFVETDEARYYFLRKETSDGDTVVGFIDCTREIDSFRTFYYSSIGFAFLLMAVLLVIITALSKRAMEPYIENIESQKQFITNAGHELKTPLAIISANTEVIEMMNGKSEWTDSIMGQVKRGTSLINELITLSRMTETQEIVLSDVDISKTVQECADSFRTVIAQNKHTLCTQIEANLHVKAEQKMLTELVNILIDNANKYCDDGGTVTVALRRRSKTGVALHVSNNYIDGVHTDYSRFFQRFYRGDTSHNSKKSGYGIGLSMAQTITEKFSGNINAKWKDGIVTFTVTL